VSRDVVLIRPVVGVRPTIRNHNRPGECPVRSERIDETPVVVKPALRSPDSFHEHRRRKSGDGAERTQHIVGPYRRAVLSHDHHEYPTPVGLIGRRQHRRAILVFQ
jgi:hypothetical protein